jgi:hypothetical protein
MGNVYQKYLTAISRLFPSPEIVNITRCLRFSGSLGSPVTYIEVVQYIMYIA